MDGNLIVVGKHGLNDKGQGYFYYDPDSRRFLFRLDTTVYEIQDEEIDTGNPNNLHTLMADNFLNIFKMPVIVTDNGLIEVQIASTSDPSANFKLTRRDVNTLEEVESEYPLLFELMEDDELYREVLIKDVK